MNRIYPTTARRRATRGWSLAVLVLGLVLLLLLAGTVMAQDPYYLEWYLIGGGGQVSSSGKYIVQGTAGQSAAAPPFPHSKSFVVSGGFWFGDSPPTFEWVYLPLTIRYH